MCPCVALHLPSQTLPGMHVCTIAGVPALTGRPWLFSSPHPAQGWGLRRHIQHHINDWRSLLVEPA